MSKTATILTCLGAAGVIATSVLTAKATPKALALIKESEEKKGEELTKIEAVKAAGPAYIPAILTGVSTIACVFGANILNKHHQATLAGAYALLDSSYKTYRSKTNALYGTSAGKEIKTEMAKDVAEDNDIPDGERLFFDYTSLRYFSARLDDVLQKVVIDDGLECYIISTPFD